MFGATAVTYNAMLNCGSVTMVSDQERLRILIEIAKTHHLSLDDLDDESRELDWEAFDRWSAKFWTPRETGNIHRSI